MTLVLSGQAGTIYANNYFTGHPALAHFQFGGSLPVGSTPTTPFQQSGTAYHGSGFMPTVMELDSIECVSNFGGSLKFLFRQAEDIQYEVGNGTYVWDLHGLKVAIYAVPTANSLYVQNQALAVATSVEFLPTEAIAYTIGAWPAGGSPTLPSKAKQEGDQAAALNTVLQAVNINVQPIQKMAIGVARALNQPLFSSPNTIVDAVHIGDGRLDLITRQGVRVAEVNMRINGIDVNTEPGGEEFHLTAYEGTGPGYMWRALRRDMKLDQNESSSWFRLASFPVTASCNPQLFTLHYDLLEKDDAPVVGGSTIFTSPDHFRVDSHTISVACDVLNTAPINVAYDQGSVNSIDIYKGITNSLAGNMSVGYRVTPRLR